LPVVKQLHDEVMARISVSAAKYRVALRSVNDIALLWMSKNEDVKMYEKMGLGRGTSNNIVMHVYGRVLKYISHQIVRSKKLTILIDGTTDRKQRSPLAIELTGIDPMNQDEKWFVLFSL
jgi:hypothetical protein